MPQPAELKEVWKNVAAHGYELPAVEFDGKPAGRFACMSNFFEHEPFSFTVPECCGRTMLKKGGCAPTVQITFAEKAIMLCKAATMGDYETYTKILAAETATETKTLGRSVCNFDQEAWDRVVCEVARQVAVQKFAGVPGLYDVLASTLNYVIAEMVPKDRIWATGLDMGHADASQPANWGGTNILGWSLMQAREALGRAMAAHSKCLADMRPADKKLQTPSSSMLKSAPPPAEAAEQQPVVEAPAEVEASEEAEEPVVAQDDVEQPSEEAAEEEAAEEEQPAEEAQEEAQEEGEVEAEAEAEVAAEEEDE